MTDAPILYSAPMVRAHIEDRKTMTRRHAWRWKDYGECGADHRPDDGRYGKVPTIWQKRKAGDRLWVRERTMCETVGMSTGMGRRIKVRYMADEAKSDWIVFPDRLQFEPTAGKCLSMGCYREASRITDIVTETKMEPLHAITEADALAEGIEYELTTSSGRFYRNYVMESGECPHFPYGSFESLWRSLHGDHGWDANPEVVALTFSVHKTNIDTMEKAA